MSGGSDFRLVPLDCPSCGASVEARGEDVVYYCTACRNGYKFDLAKEGLEPVEVAFVAAANVAAETYLPFWLLPARVGIERRATGGGLSGLLSFFTGESGSGSRDGEGTFAVPAFHAPLEAAVSLTRSYTERFPKLGERLGERLLGGCYGPEDARKLVHYSVIATEVEKPDTLRNLKYTIDFGEERLLGVPFARSGEKLVDAIFGVAI